MTGVVFRPFAPGDGPRLAALHRRAILAVPAAVYTDDERDSWATGIRPDLYAPAEGGGIEVAVAPDGRVAGFCHNHADEVLGLYVDPDWQGRGVGAGLMARAEAAIAACGCRRVRVKATLSAQGFYERYGYVVTAPSTHRTRGGLVLAAVLLEKPLA